jgi:hypothetical protein
VNWCGCVEGEGEGGITGGGGGGVYGRDAGRGGPPSVCLEGEGRASDGVVKCFERELVRCLGMVGRIGVEVRGWARLNGIHEGRNRRVSGGAGATGPAEWGVGVCSQGRARRRAAHALAVRIPDAAMTRTLQLQGPAPGAPAAARGAVEAGRGAGGSCRAPAAGI